MRFSWVDLSGGLGIASDVLATLGIGVVLGLMAFGFFGTRVALVVGAVATVAAAPFTIGFLHTYPVLSGSLVAYAASTVVCVALTLLSKDRFDFALIKERTGDFDMEPAATGRPADEPRRGEPVAAGEGIS